jgi:peroxiredoxin
MRNILSVVLLLVLCVSTSYSATFKGKLLDTAGKPIEKVGIMTIVNTKDGSQEITTHSVDAKGNYSFKLDWTGYVQLLIGIDTVDKLFIPMFVNNDQTYQLNIRLPYTNYPYIPLQDVKLTSANKQIVKNIYTLDSIFNTADMIASSFRLYLGSKNITTYQQDVQPYLNYLTKTYNSTKDNGIKFMAGVSYINILDAVAPLIDKGLLNQNLLNNFVETYTYKTPYLHSAMINYSNIARVLPDEFDNEYLQNIIKLSDSKYVKSEALSQAVAYYFDERKDKAKSARFYNELEKDYPEQKSAMLAKLKYDPKKQIQVGNPLPQFSAASMDDSSIIFNNDYFKGKYLLLHFWHTGLPENNVQISDLTSAVEQLFDKHFEVLSISFDDSAAVVQAYRRENYAMKWDHIWNGSDEKLFNLFEIYKLPYFILVGPDGKVIALNDELVGRDFLKKLETLVK